MPGKGDSIKITSLVMTEICGATFQLSADSTSQARSDMFACFPFSTPSRPPNNQAADENSQWQNNDAPDESEDGLLS